VRLTKDTIERAKLPEPGRKERFIRDDVVRGLGVRITASGARSFVFEGRIKGRPRRITIGPWPDLNVVLARERAMEIRTAIAKGDDPADDAAEARKELTLDALWSTYLERHAKPHKRSAARDEWLFKRYVPPGWHGRRLSALSRNDIARLHAKIGDEHGHYAANRTLALLRTVFNLARTWELFKHDNPAQGIKPFKEHKRQRYLSPEELQRVNTALLDEPDWRWRAWFPLAVMLGARRGELLSMRWADIDFNARTWLIPQTKDGESHLLPLPAPVIAILEGLPSRDNSEWTFPGVGASGHLMQPRNAWLRILQRAGVEGVRVHDLRHTLASWLVAQGFNLPLIGRALNHTQAATTQRYAHLALDPVRAALEQTASLMTRSQGSLVTNGAGK
jgi:integrase